jgi:hypothetical protein
VREARRQEEEARQREKAAMEPDLKIRVRPIRMTLIRIFLTNIKQTPVYIYDFHIFGHSIVEDGKIERNGHGIHDEEIKTEVPEMVSFGDVCITRIPIGTLIESLQMQGESRGVFRGSFYLVSGQVYTVSILLEYSLFGPKNSPDHDFWWNVYAYPFDADTIDEIKTKENYLASYKGGNFSYTPIIEETKD